MKCINWNILSGGGSRKEKIIERIKTYDADIVVLTEFRQGESGRYLREQLDHIGLTNQAITAKKSNTHNGVLIASRFPVCESALPTLSTKLSTNVLVCNVNKLIIVAAFCNDQATFNELMMYVESIPCTDVLLIGDLLHGDRRSDPTHYQKSLKRLLKNNWIDIWRKDNPRSNVFCHTNKGNSGQSRPDHVFANGQAENWVVDCEYDMKPLEDGLSDHAPMLFTLENQVVSEVTLPAISTIGQIDSRVNMATHQLMMACRHSAKVKEIEAQNVDKEYGGFFDEILQNSMGVALQTVACLESCANELFFEDKLSNNVINNSATKIFSPIIGKMSVIDKYATAIALVKDQHLELGSKPTQDVAALIQLRNNLVHFRPEWYSSQKQHKKLSRNIEGKFERSQYLPSDHLFPLAWASSGFADWALDSTIMFLRKVYAEMDITCPIDIIQDKINSLRT